MNLNIDTEDIAIHVNISGTVETINMRDDLRIHGDNIEMLIEDMVNQPSWYAWYSALLATQEAEYDRLESKLKMTYCEYSMDLRKGKIKILDEDGKAIKITEGMIENYIKTIPKYQIIEEELYEKEINIKKLKAIVNASIQKKDMLMQLGALKRQELDHLYMRQDFKKPN